MGVWAGKKTGKAREESTALFFAAVWSDVQFPVTLYPLQLLQIFYTFVPILTIPHNSDF
jgi:hypothetical protein